MKITTKAVKTWMKTLPENKWRKTYNVDARRVAYFAKFGNDSTLPESLQRVGEYDYKREKSMAKNYISSIKEAERKKKKQSMAEQKIRLMVLEIIEEKIKRKI